MIDRCWQCYDQELDELRAALKRARQHIITLGGNPDRYPAGEGDMIHADVVEEIDRALRS